MRPPHATPTTPISIAVSLFKIVAVVYQVCLEVRGVTSGRDGALLDRTNARSSVAVTLTVRQGCLFFMACGWHDRVCLCLFSFDCMHGGPVLTLANTVSGITHSLNKLGDYRNLQGNVDFN